MAKLRLKQEISVQDLQKGVEFEVDADNYDPSEDNFDDVPYDKELELEAEYDDSVKPRFLSDTDVPFHVLKEKMKPITKDGLILKEVFKSGVGEIIPDKSVVFMHYDAYLEGRKEPFDSTRLRGKPFKFLFGDGNLIPGLEIGVQTMRKDEHSRIMVSPKYAFGEMGCPPRIPENAEILYEVQILYFFAGKEAVEFEEMSSEEKKKAPFDKVAGVYHCENTVANDLFHKKMYKQAIARYRRAMNLLEDVSVANEEEDEQRKGHLLKLYLNLAQCYLNIQNPPKAIIYADLALKLDPENPKGLYRMGTALFQTGNYDRGQYYLCQAKRHKPYENSINKAIKKLEQKRKEHRDWEKNFCGNIFGVERNVGKPNQFEEPSEFVNVINNEVNEFLESDDQELGFPSSYTESQLEVVKFLAQKYNLAYVSKIQCGEKINKIAKRQQSS